MTANEVLRLVWTAVGFGGSAAGLFALSFMLWLMSDARKTDRAVSQLHTPRAEFMRITTRGEVVDLKMKAWAIGALCVAVTADGLAGIGAYLTWNPAIIIGGLIAGEVLMVGAIALLAALGLMKWWRRNQLFAAIKFSRTEP